MAIVKGIDCNDKRQKHKCKIFHRIIIIQNFVCNNKQQDHLQKEVLKRDTTSIFDFNKNKANGEKITWIKDKSNWHLRLEGEKLRTLKNYWEKG